MSRIPTRSSPPLLSFLLSTPFSSLLTLFFSLFPQFFISSARSTAQQALRRQELITEMILLITTNAPSPPSSRSTLERRSLREASRSEAPSRERRASSPAAFRHPGAAEGNA